MSHHALLAFGPDGDKTSNRDIKTKQQGKNSGVKLIKSKLINSSRESAVINNVDEIPKETKYTAQFGDQCEQGQDYITDESNDIKQVCINKSSNLVSQSKLVAIDNTLNQSVKSSNETNYLSSTESEIFCLNCNQLIDETSEHHQFKCALCHGYIHDICMQKSNGVNFKFLTCMRAAVKSPFLYVCNHCKPIIPSVIGLFQQQLDLISNTRGVLT